MNNRVTQLSTKNLNISCVIPVYNEAENLKPFITVLEETLSQITHQYDIIIVNDGSTDHTQHELRQITTNPHIKWINFSRNFGKEAALTAGLDHANGDIVLMMDADFQHPFTLIHPMIQKWSEGFDVIYGVQEKRQSQNWFIKSASRAFYQLMNKISKIDLPENAGDFRVLDKKVVHELRRLEERERFMKGLYAWVGFSHIGIPFEPQERQAGSSGWGLKKLFELALVGITSFSNAPLRFSSYLGLFISLASFVYGSVFVIKTLMFGDAVHGFPTLIVVISFLGGVQLLSIGILGEYIAKIFNEVKRRPPYIINEKKGFDPS